jgi:hypothetical protein
VDGYLDAVSFAGVGFFTVGFGDLVPTADLPAGGGREHVVANPRS